MGFRDDLKRMMGAPLLDVELDDPSDYTLIESQVLRYVSSYFPVEKFIRKSVPAVGGIMGQGNIDLTTETTLLEVKEVFVIKAPQNAADVLLPWSLVRIWEKIWVGASEFVGTDLLLYQNELSAIARASNNVFWWKWDLSSKKLYVCGAPSWASGIGILYMGAVADLDSIVGNPMQYQLALDLGVAIAKQKIGQAMRKYKVEGVELPGKDYVDEGKKEMEDVIKKCEEMAYYPGGLA